MVVYKERLKFKLFSFLMLHPLPWPIMQGVQAQASPLMHECDGNILQTAFQALTVPRATPAWEAALRHLMRGRRKRRIGYGTIWHCLRGPCCAAKDQVSHCQAMGIMLQ